MNKEPDGRVGQRRQVGKIFENSACRRAISFAQKGNSVVLKPKRVVDPDDVLTPEEGALIAKARREMREGKYLTLDQLEHDLAHKHPPRRRKTT